MSADPVKKRGRPKKVISDPVEAVIPEGTKKTTARSKSTVAASKSVISKPATQKTPQPVKSTSKSWHNPPNSQKSPANPPPQQETASKIVQNPKPTKTNPKSPVTPEASKILSQVRALPVNNVIPPGDIKKPSKPAPTTASSNAKTSTSNPIPTLKSLPQSTHQSKSQSNPPSNTSNPPPPKPAAKIPVASLNSQIVDNIATRAGARPNIAGSKSSLPPNYMPVARKVTMTIVALPILLVTSWVLYERLILGEDRKVLVKPGLLMVEGQGDSGKGGESSPST